MTTSRKRKISAREILADMRSGLDDSALKRKYRLSEGALETVYRKLATAGALTKGEIRERLGAVAEAVDPAHEEPGAGAWRCPACNAPQPSEVDECPVCGVIVAQFQAFKARESHGPSLDWEKQSPTGRPWIVVVGGLVALALAGTAWMLWPKPQPEETKKIARTEVRSTPKAKVQEAPISETGELMELNFSPEGFPLGLSVSQGSGLHLFDTPSKDQGFKKLPPETDAQRHYDEFTIAGQKFLVVTEESDPPRFYFDANRNGDLTDDPGPYTGERPEGVVPNNYTIQVPYKGEQGLAPYRMWIFPSRMGGTRFYPACHWRGQLDISGKAYRLVLFDANADGDYSNDLAVIDVNADGKASEDEKLKPGQSVELAGTVVKLVSIAPSGRWIRIEYAEAETGPEATDTDNASE